MPYQPTLHNLRQRAFLENAYCAILTVKMLCVTCRTSSPWNDSHLTEVGAALPAPKLLHN